MAALAPAILTSKSAAVPAILLGGMLAGTLDLTAAITQWALRGVSPIRIMQAIASGLLGAEAFQGGAQSAALGVVLHFMIAFSATAVFYVASRKLTFMTGRFIVSGALYGVAVHLFMQSVVLPLSAVRKSPFSMEQFLIGMVIHIFCVGLPIAFVVRRYSR